MKLKKKQRLKRISIERFSVFKKAEIEFCPGINIIIGENATGKTHLLKLIYSMLKPFEHSRDPDQSLNGKLAGVFRPDDKDTTRLVRNSGGALAADARLEYGADSSVEFTISRVEGMSKAQVTDVTPQVIFIPPREALAMYEGFIASYENRELSFDETYYDLCKQLSATPLKGSARSRIEPILKELKEIIGGTVLKRGGRFYLRETPPPNGKDKDTNTSHSLEATLLAEGYRKLAMLYRLIDNGSLQANTILLIDEPEASLNPKLTVPMTKILRLLAGLGVQIFISTHDYLLSYEMSLSVEYPDETKIPMKFFSLSRKDRRSPVETESGNRMAELEHNSILDEFGAHYDREQMLFAVSVNGGKHARGR